MMTVVQVVSGLDEDSTVDVTVTLPNPHKVGRCTSQNGKLDSLRTTKKRDSLQIRKICKIHSKELEELVIPDFWFVI